MSPKAATPPFIFCSRCLTNPLHPARSAPLRLNVAKRAALQPRAQLHLNAAKRAALRETHGTAGARAPPSPHAGDISAAAAAASQYGKMCGAAALRRCCCCAAALLAAGLPGDAGRRDLLRGGLVEALQRDVADLVEGDGVRHRGDTDDRAGEGRVTGLRGQMKERKFPEAVTFLLRVSRCESSGADYLQWAKRA